MASYDHPIITEIYQTINKAGKQKKKKGNSDI